MIRGVQAKTVREVIAKREVQREVIAKREVIEYIETQPSTNDQRSSSENSDRSYSEKDLLDVLLEMRSDEFTVLLWLLIDCSQLFLSIGFCYITNFQIYFGGNASYRITSRFCYTTNFHIDYMGNLLAYFIDRSLHFDQTFMEKIIKASPSFSCLIIFVARLIWCRG